MQFSHHDYKELNSEPFFCTAPLTIAAFFAAAAFTYVYTHMQLYFQVRSFTFQDHPKVVVGLFLGVVKPFKQSILQTHHFRTCRVHTQAARVGL